MKKLIFLLAAAILFIAASPNVTFAKHDAVKAEVSKTNSTASVNVIAPMSNDVFITYHTLESPILTLAAVKCHEYSYTSVPTIRRTDITYSIKTYTTTATVVINRNKQYFIPPLMRC